MHFHMKLYHSGLRQEEGKADYNPSQGIVCKMWRYFLIIMTRAIQLTSKGQGCN